MMAGRQRVYSFSCFKQCLHACGLARSRVDDVVVVAAAGNFGEGGVGHPKGDPAGELGGSAAGARVRLPYLSYLR